MININQKPVCHRFCDLCGTLCLKEGNFLNLQPARCMTCDRKFLEFCQKGQFTNFRNTFNIEILKLPVWKIRKTKQNKRKMIALVGKHNGNLHMNKKLLNKCFVYLTLRLVQNPPYGHENQEIFQYSKFNWIWVIWE